MVKHGIDVSKFQGLIDWQEVKKHIDFAIIRCGYGSNLESQDDPYFKRNADECTRLKIPFGVYLYSYATNEREALSEAEHVLRLVKDYQMAYPVYYDLEDNNISLDDFFRNDTKKIHGLLDVILEEAQKSIGIMMDGGVMSLQLAPQPNHTILLTISSGHDEFSDMIRNAGKMMTDRILSDIHDAGSNVIKKEDAGDAIKSAPFVPVEKLEEQIKNKLKKTAKQQEGQMIAIYRFASMQAVEEFAQNCPKTWGLKNSLYKHKEQACFYYIVERTRCAQEKYQYICDLLTEYGGYVSSKKETAAYIMEHCEILIENNAVNIMKKYCM